MTALGSDFTIECWVYPTSFADYNTIWDNRASDADANGCVLALNAANKVYFYTNSSFQLTTTTALVANRWTHLALVRSGSGSGNVKIYINGVADATTATYTTSFSRTAASIGGDWNTRSNLQFFGYISNFRTLTTALYTTTFTPPTQLFPVTNTTLLTCQSPTIIDNSGSAVAITLAGSTTPVVSNFTPFAAYQGFNPALGAAAGGVWTLDEAAYYQNNRQWPIYDPYFKNTTLMLHGNGTNAAQNNTFLDSSTNNFTITRNGNTTQGSFSPFSQTGWSYNGTAGAYCTLNNADYSLGTGDFTVETWMYCVDDSTYSYANICSAPSNPNFTVGFGGGGGSGARQLYVEYGGSATGIGNNMSGYLNRWTHIAVVRQSGTVTAYQNGVSLGSISKSASVGSTANLYLLRNTGDGGMDFRGYMSNYRITKAAVYSSNFTPSTAPFAPVSNTVLLAFQSNSFVDNSALRATVTPAGTASIQAFSPFVPAYITPTTYSNYFDGSGDYLTASGAGLALGAGNFTVEGWFYTTGYNTGEAIYSGLNTYPASTGLLFYINGSGTYTVDVNGSNVIASGTAPLNTWTHVALVRSSTGSNGLALYINGVSIATGTTANDFTSTYAVIGRTGFGAASNFWLGCLSNIRVLVGTALYTANFTPPTAPLTNITNTSLLTCQSSTFIDNSTNNFTITANGNVQPVTSPTPFPAKVDTTTLNSAYSTSLIGGSGYFDGTGDYLSMTSGTSLGSGNFTIEAWVYLTAAAVGETTVGSSTNYYTSGFNGNFVFRVGTTNLWQSFDGQGSAEGISGSYTWQTNTWTHVAWVRSGSTLTVYKNGVSIASGTVSKTLSDSANGYSIGAGRVNGSVSQAPITGYISGLRTVVGTALYPAAFAPPVAPPTPVTNTSLLLNYTNGAIFDNTAKNVLETVGNAQISTTQSKWGGSSMYFDGTGDRVHISPNTSQNVVLGTGDFTIEMWIYPTATSASTINLFSGDTNSAYLAWATSGLWFGTYNVNWILQSSVSPALNTWSHIAVTRLGTTTNLFVNGVAAVASTSSSQNFSAASYVIGGDQVGGTVSLTGYIDDLRITKGVARYITNFTPPTSQLQDQ
jgi:hypothetical protein